MYLNPNMKEDNPNFNYYRYCTSHELFHIMYQELGWEKLEFEKFRELMYNEDGITKYDEFI